MKRQRFNEIIFLLTFLVLVTSCEKSNSYSYKDLLGSWISTDLADTIEFTSDKDLYKLFSGVKDHFDYGLSEAEITIRYNGMLYVLISPSTHPYNINEDQLTIDFRPSCYGFRGQKITFKKSKN